MNHWLKLALSSFAVAVLAITGVVQPGSGVSPASANTDPTGTVIHGARNTTIWVGADAAGVLHWSENQGTSWTSSGFGLTKSGVTSVVWTGSQFLATSYFEAARSSDGKNWTRFMLPLGSAFDPGNIISDAEFFRSGSMSAEAIQSFLEQRNPDCRSGFVCMKDYRETTFSRDASVLCNAYEGAENETAAQIIAKVSAACGVSAEALLVLIQKEQSLVTLSAPSTIRFERATGYACPDTAPCNAQFFGFYNQVYNAAKQFKRYSNPPGTSRFFTWFPIGRTSQVRLHPNASCGTTPVTIRNQATAGLYYYTPYTPNQIAMVNLATAGDSCSSYGNRNFWRVYNYWFNPTKDFRTWATTRDGVTMVVDRDGTIATSRDLSNWQRIGVVPGASPANAVSEFGQSNQGNYAVLTADGKAFQSADGVSWSEMIVQSTQASQDIVTRHTVRSGDTVWGIARANAVTVASVVAENALPQSGSLIRVGQVLTITKRGVVTTVNSPVILDPSIVITSGATRPNPPAEVVDPPAADPEAPVDPNAPVDPDASPEAPTEETPAEDAEPDVPLPALEPLVVERVTNDVFYTVARGDTMLRIAFRNRTTVSKLAADNGIRNVNRIRVGQRLKVGQTTQEMSYHRAQEGDTLERVAERRSVTLSTLLTLNTSLQSGQAITVGTLVRLS
ncbi:MAG: LysM peptidoglycan-binding domain-containing protein [Pontimonas sp.]|nr:LysM peptidoglycan-binding domain-containing protein [Pontimonas sp.]